MSAERNIDTIIINASDGTIALSRDVPCGKYKLSWDILSL